MESSAETEKLNIRGLNYNIFTRLSSRDSDKFILFLHGFCGSHASFSHIYDSVPDEWNIIAPDLLGHGDTESPKELLRYETEHQTADLRQILLHYKASKCVTAGYSMGGRLAIQYAIRHSNGLKGLFLESTTAGFEDSTESLKRVEADQKTAGLIIDDFDEFLDTWNQKKVFETPVKIDEVLEKCMMDIRRNQNPAGLAHSLLGFGTGVMPPTQKFLKLIRCPVSVLAGEYDAKFIEKGREIHSKLKNSEFQIIEKSGHRIHLENPDSYLQKLLSFISAGT